MLCLTGREEKRKESTGKGSAAMLIPSGSGSVDFQEFVGGLSAFSSKGGREEKLRCEWTSTSLSRGRPVCRGITLTAVAFKVYDMDRDGYISNGELYLVLKQMVGNNLKVGSG